MDAKLLNKILANWMTNVLKTSKAKSWLNEGYHTNVGSVQ